MSDFKRMHDGSPVHLLDHVREAVSSNPGMEVLVGSDSHDRGDHTVYTTTVVLRYWRNGAHVIYRRERAARVGDLWSRLWVKWSAVSQ